MNIGGISIILVLGVINLTLILFQLMSGMHVIRIPVKVHRVSGIALCVSATLHAIIAILAH